MRIVHLIWAFPIGGAETMLVDIMNIQRLHAKITLIIVNDFVNENLINQIHKDVRVIRINRPPKSNNLFFIIKLWLRIFLSRAQVIHCHNASLWKFLKGLNYKSCLTVHDVSFISKNFKHYNKLFAISKSVKDFIYKETKLNASLVYNGIDTKSIKVKGNFSFDRFKIVQISRLEHDKKGQDVLIKALKYLIYDLGIENVQLDLIGTGSSLDYLKELVSINYLQNYIHFKGEIDKQIVNETICDYNLLVQPSIWEGFGLTVVEAMAAKVPVLVSDIDGPIEIIQNGLLGSCFESGNHKDCALKLQDIISNYIHYSSEDRLQKIREFTISNFDISETAKNYLKEYEKKL